MNELVDKYIESSDLFAIFIRDYTFVMDALPVVKINQMLNLLTAILQNKVQNLETVEKKHFEQIFLYCMSWALVGLCETEEREKFHKYLESKNAPLPPISP